MSLEIIVNTKNLRENCRTVTGQCHKYGINIAAVTKCVCSQRRIAEIAVECGADQIADSRIEHLSRLTNLGVDRMLIRLGAVSEAKKIVDGCEISLESDIRTITAINEAAAEKHKNHKIILMIDMGDLREGVLFTNEEAVYSMVEKILSLTSITLWGIGANYSCLSGVLPSWENLKILSDLAEKIRRKYAIECPIVSGGGTSTYTLFLRKALPKGINHLRIGEAMLFGFDTSNNCTLSDLHTDVFSVESELIEIYKKNSEPIGEIGRNAFGKKCVFGNNVSFEQKRGICAIGVADTDIDILTPKNDKIRIIGGCSDVTVMDLSQCPDYHVGDMIRFQLQYGSLLRLAFSGRNDWKYE